MAVCCMPKPEEFESLSEYDYAYLNLQKTVDEKIYAVQNLLRINDQEIYERSRIIRYITDLLKPFYPECEVIVFGSSANGFGFRGCDLDLLFVPFPGYCNLDFKEKDETIPSPFQVKSGNYPKKFLYLMCEISHLKFVQKVMRARRFYFRKITFIPAKCPILHLEFFENSISCDFSASNRLVVNNTELQWMYAKLHRCVRPLVMFLRYWAKSLGFISKTHLSSYAFTLLVIFYLQNTEPSVLPSVKYLKELADYSRKIDGWESAICTDPEIINARRFENQDSISHHLIMFFDFYWGFNFVQNVVSPHSGKALPVIELKTSKEERIREFQVTPFSIQDPFILSRNISRNSTMKTSFKLASLIAKKLLLSKNFSLEKFFNLSYYQQEMDSMFSCVDNYLPSVFISHSLQLTHDLCLKLGAAVVLDSWFERVCEAVLDILQYGLLLECEVVDKTLWYSAATSHPAKRKKVSRDSIGDLELIMCIQCAACFPTLWGRKSNEVQSNLNEEENEAGLPNALIKDYRISRQLAKAHTRSTTDELSDENQNPFLRFTCNIFRYRFPQISDVVVCISPLTDAKKFGQVDKFLIAFIRKLVTDVLMGD